MSSSMNLDAAAPTHQPLRLHRLHSLARLCLHMPGKRRWAAPGVTLFSLSDITGSGHSLETLLPHHRDAQLV